MRYKQEQDGAWVRPVKRGYKMMCCDCGLVHVLDFKHVPYGSGRKIIFRVRRDIRATSAARREIIKRNRKK